MISELELTFPNGSSDYGKAFLAYHLPFFFQIDLSLFQEGRRYCDSQLPFSSHSLTTRLSMMAEPSCSGDI
jgi:hypothetical protein